jgi:hypothetical protein
MGLNFGWKAHDTRESIWSGDPALVDVPEVALEEWVKDGEARHLLPYAKAGQPSIIEFRALSIDESQHLELYRTGLGSGEESFARFLLMAFRMGVRFKDAPERGYRDHKGQEHAMLVRERGIAMLAEGFCDYIEREYPGIIGFYGVKVYFATRPSEPEKKASSPLSTQTPSSAAVSTTVVTGALDVAGPPVA